MASFTADHRRAGLAYRPAAIHNPTVKHLQAEGWLAGGPVRPVLRNVPLRAALWCPAMEAAAYAALPRSGYPSKQTWLSGAVFPPNARLAARSAAALLAAAGRGKRP
jgi:hypothetical protein